MLQKQMVNDLLWGRVPSEQRFLLPDSKVTESLMCWDGPFLRQRVGEWGAGF